MRHGKSGRKLKRTASHRRATLASLSTSLLRHKRITTTIAKAKETRSVVEKMITRAKNAVAREDTPGVGVHARREVGRMIKDRSVLAELFSTIAPKVADRPGGYTRVVKLGQRPGDGAEMAVIELVDFALGQDKTDEPKAETKKSKRTKKAPAATAEETAPVEEKPKKKKGSKESKEKESR